MLRRTLRAEFIKLCAGRTLLVLSLFSAVLNATAMFGTGRTLADERVIGVVGADDATQQILSLGFASSLFAMIVGVLIVTREFQNESIIRSLISAGRVRNLFLGKAVAATGSGVVFGLVGAGTGIAAATLWAAQQDVQLEWNSEMVKTAIGVFLVSGLAGPWGAALGWLGRRQVPTIIGAIVWTLAAETAVLALFPSIGRWIPGGAQLAIYRDQSFETVGWAVGIVVFCCWVVVVTTVAWLAIDKKGLG